MNPSTESKRPLCERGANRFSWRAEEAAFYILLPVIEPGKDLQNTPIQSQIQHILQEALQSTSPIPTPKYSFPLSYRIDVIDPVVCGSVMAAAFTLSQTDDNRRHWIPLLQKIISSDSPILKLQGLLTILRTSTPPPSLLIVVLVHR